MTKAIRMAFAAILTLLAVSFLTFLLMKIVPGGPFDSERSLPPEVLANLEAKFRLDLPWWEQYFLYMRDLLLHFDMGPSIKYIGVEVSDIVFESLPVSLELGVYALIVSVSVGVTLGIIAAAFRNTTLDYSADFLAVSGVSLPSFLVAALAILVFSVKLGWLPTAFWDSPAHKILPSIVLGLRPAAIIARLTRSSVLEVLHMDFVRTARAKGLSAQTVMVLHVLRNALTPIITVLGPLSATILTGSFVVEHIFSVPGMASHFIEAVNNRDFPLIMGVTMIYASFIVVANLIVDLLYLVIDPRMRSPN